MVTLWGCDGQTVGDLAKKLLLVSSTLTPILQRLETAGLIERVRGDEDERLVFARLTSKGAAMREDAREIPSAVFKASGLSPEGFERIKSDIKEVRTAVDRATSRWPGATR